MSGLNDLTEDIAHVFLTNSTRMCVSHEFQRYIPEAAT